MYHSFVFFIFNFLLLLNYSCMPFLPIPPPHPSWTYLPPPPPPSPFSSISILQISLTLLTSCPSLIPDWPKVHPYLDGCYITEKCWIHLETRANICLSSLTSNSYAFSLTILFLILVYAHFSHHSCQAFSSPSHCLPILCDAFSSCIVLS